MSVRAGAVLESSIRKTGSASAVEDQSPEEKTHRLTHPALVPQHRIYAFEHSRLDDSREVVRLQWTFGLAMRLVHLDTRLEFANNSTTRQDITYGPVGPQLCSAPWLNPFLVQSGGNHVGADTGKRHYENAPNKSDTVPDKFPPGPVLAQF